MAWIQTGEIFKIRDILDACALFCLFFLSMFIERRTLVLNQIQVSKITLEAIESNGV